MTETPQLDEWVVIVEFRSPAQHPVGHETLLAVVTDLRAWKVTALCSSDRYALHLNVMAERPSEAFHLAVDLHDHALAALGITGSTLLRGEVMTNADFERRRDDPDPPPVVADVYETLLSNDIYWATRAMFRAKTPSELTKILDEFVDAAGGEVQVGLPAPEIAPGQITIDMSLEQGKARRAVVEAATVSGLTIEHALPVLLDDARVVLARLLEPPRSR